MKEKNHNMRGSKIRKFLVDSGEALTNQIPTLALNRSNDICTSLPLPREKRSYHALLISCVDF